MEFIPYIFLSVLLGASIWVLTQIRDIIAQREKRQQFSVMDLAFTFIREKDDDFFRSPMKPQMEENLKWLYNHQVSFANPEVFVFRYLEEWDMMKRLLKSLDLKDLNEQLVKEKHTLYKEVKDIPLGSTEFTKKLAEIKAVEDNIAALRAFTRPRFSSPARPSSPPDKPQRA